MTARLTVVEQVYYQMQGDGPSAVESKYIRFLESEEQPLLRRRLRATEEWKRIDAVWLDKVGLLCIRNEETKFERNPTKEQQAEAAGKILEVTYRDGTPLAGPSAECWLVRPGQSMRAEPSDVRRLMIRCQQGETWFTVSLFPP